MSFENKLTTSQMINDDKRLRELYRENKRRRQRFLRKQERIKNNEIKRRENELKKRKQNRYQSIFNHKYKKRPLKSNKNINIIKPINNNNNNKYNINKIISSKREVKLKDKNESSIKLLPEYMPPMPDWSDNDYEPNIDILNETGLDSFERKHPTIKLPTINSDDDNSSSKYKRIKYNKPKIKKVKLKPIINIDNASLYNYKINNYFDTINDNNECKEMETPKVTNNNNNNNNNNGYSKLFSKYNNKSINDDVKCIEDNESVSIRIHNSMEFNDSNSNALLSLTSIKRDNINNYNKHNSNKYYKSLPKLTQSALDKNELIWKKQRNNNINSNNINKKPIIKSKIKMPSIFVNKNRYNNINIKRTSIISEPIKYNKINGLNGFWRNDFDSKSLYNNNIKYKYNYRYQKSEYELKIENESLELQKSLQKLNEKLKNISLKSLNKNYNSNYKPKKLLQPMRKSPIFKHNRLRKFN